MIASLVKWCVPSSTTSPASMSSSHSPIMDA
jgi:hypothetical protein